MTEKYDPYQNAVAERINGILKQEFISHLKIKNLKLMKAVVKDSIEIYNTKRPHFSNFYLTPQQMHLQSNVKMRTYEKQKTGYQLFLMLSFCVPYMLLFYRVKVPNEPRRKGIVSQRQGCLS